MGEIVLKTFENYESCRCVVLLFKMCKFSTVRSLGEGIFIRAEKDAGDTNIVVYFAVTKQIFTQRWHHFGLSLEKINSDLDIHGSQVIEMYTVNNTFYHQCIMSNGEGV